MFAPLNRLALIAGEGTAIGLALVRPIVEVHGGRIGLELAGRNQGTRFCSNLPGHHNR